MLRSSLASRLCENLGGCRDGIGESEYLRRLMLPDADTYWRRFFRLLGLSERSLSLLSVLDVWRCFDFFCSFRASNGASSSVAPSS